MRLRQLAAVSMLALVPACASTGGTSGSGDRFVITQAEIEASAAGNAYQIVQQLRPQWLRLDTVTGGALSPGATQQDPRAVFLNGRRMGELEDLRNIPTGLNITSIRFLTASQATQRWGSGFRNGAIEVTTER
jgi:hypothetical protein